MTSPIGVLGGGFDLNMEENCDSEDGVGKDLVIDIGLWWEKNEATWISVWKVSHRRPLRKDPFQCLL